MRYYGGNDTRGRDMAKKLKAGNPNFGKDYEHKFDYGNEDILDAVVPIRMNKALKSRLEKAGDKGKFCREAITEKLDKLGIY